MPDVLATPAGPMFVNFLINNTCNAHCRFCAAESQRRSGRLDRIDSHDVLLNVHGRLHARQQEQDEALDKWRQWTTDLPCDAVPYMLERYRDTVKHVSLCAFGEPMLHLGFVDMVRCVIAHPGKLTLAVTTNGSLLHRCMEIGDSPGQLVISFDSPVAEVFKHFRPGLSFGKVSMNMRAVGARKNHSGRRLYAQMAIFERNQDHLVPMVKFLRDIGFHGLSINRGYDHGIEPEPAVPRSDPRVLAQIAFVKARYPEFELIDNFTTHDGVWATPRGQFCQLPWRQIEVLPDGSTDVCCRAIYESMGKYNEDPWNSPTMNELRRQLSTFSVDSAKFTVCSVCSMKGEP
jgi:wyosine [tRNA(Phe)-imidazoG37] synthetase (radical SAM superfamily)